MTILESDIKLMKSERLTDYDDGGGKMTGNVVVDGEVNNLFPDISALDRVYGRVSLRKGYVAVDTNNTDTYYGAHCIVTDPPDDPNVNVTLFTTESWTDERAAARDDVESYLAMGGESRYVLYGNHLEGQRAIMVYCRANAPTPEVGEVYVMHQEKTGYTTQTQYVRVTKIISRVETVIENGTGSTCGTFVRDVITFEISNPLRYLFYASAVTCLTNHGSPTLVRTTLVADAAQYAGVARLAVDAAVNDLSLKVPSIFGQLVPSTQVETPVLDALAGMTQTPMVASGAAGAATISLSVSVGENTPYTCYFKGPVARNSVAITAIAALKDDGNGNIVAAAGDASGFTGSIVYETGALTLTRTSYWATTLTASATPAGAATENAFSASTDITIQNRQYNYVMTMLPVPAPGTVVVDYRSQGKWVRLTDDGAGKLYGRDGEGTGTVDYATGSALLTVGALPDVNSSVIWTWAAPASYVKRSGDASIAPPAIRHTLAGGSVKPLSFSAAWLSGGFTKTATDDGMGGITGAATGSILYSSGEVYLKPLLLPDSNTLVDFGWTYQTQFAESFTASGNIVNFTLANVPVKPRSLLIELPLWREASEFHDPEENGMSPYTLRLADDGAGNLTGVTGTINYDTGAVSFDVSTSVYRSCYWVPVEYETTYGNSLWVCDADTPDAITSPTLFDVAYSLSTASDNIASEQAALPPLQIDLTPLVKDTVVSGSVRFSLNGETYVDRSGTLYKGVSATTNSGTAAGGINYATGVATLTGWTGGGSTALSVSSLLTRIGQWSAVECFFRTPGSPLRPGSLYLRATRLDGQQIYATADMNGNLLAAEINGTVDVETGVVKVSFGKFVEDATLTPAEKLEWWYVAPVAPATAVWMPTQVLPNTLFFNAVVYSNMPLDADLLGLDPVRLPMDGRVPVFKTGNVVVVHDTQNFTMPNPLSAGQVVALPRALLAYAVLYDAAGVKIPTAQYTPDLVAGAIAMADPLDIAAYAQPFVCEHRVEDMALVSDVQITGEIAIVSGLKHAYTAANSLLSSALIIGDMQARPNKFFSQTTWTSVWSDTIIGSATTAQYNDTLYPVQVANRGAIQERWAIIFTSSTAFNIVGEYSGVIGTGNTSTNAIPINPITGTPYFTLLAAGWGSGWATGNTVRFNTIAANYPLWLARTTTMGDVVEPNDNFKLQIRGDAD